MARSRVAGYTQFHVVRTPPRAAADDFFSRLASARWQHQRVGRQNMCFRLVFLVVPCLFVAVGLALAISQAQILGVAASTRPDADFEALTAGCTITRIQHCWHTDYSCEKRGSTRTCTKRCYDDYNASFATPSGLEVAERMQSIERDHSICGFGCDDDDSTSTLSSGSFRVGENVPCWKPTAGSDLMQTTMLETDQIGSPERPQPWGKPSDREFNSSMHLNNIALVAPTQRAVYRCANPGCWKVFKPADEVGTYVGGAAGGLIFGIIFAGFACMFWCCAFCMMGPPDGEDCPSCPRNCPTYHRRHRELSRRNMQRARTARHFVRDLSPSRRTQQQSTTERADDVVSGVVLPDNAQCGSAPVVQGYIVQAPTATAV